MPGPSHRETVRYTRLKRHAQADKSGGGTRWHAHRSGFAKGLPADTDTPPVPVLPTSRPVTSDCALLTHRGFQLRLRAQAGSGFAVAIEDAGLTLHTETGHRSAFAAERAARRFVDDALGVFDVATSSLAA